jgi:hypothetical protein
MFNLFRVIVDRIKAVFATAAALELEGEFLARDAERRAELLRQADRYDAEGLTTVAARLRQMAEATSAETPTASVLPALAHLRGEAKPLTTTPALPESAANGDRLPVPSNGRRKGR